MNILLLVAGSALVLWAIMEAIWTTLWIDGHGGPLTKRAARWSWELMRRATPRGAHRFLSLAGPLIFVHTVVGWIVLLGLGWALVFYSDPRALADPHDGSPPTFAGALWFSAYTLSTVGNGDFAPSEGAWQLVASLMGASGITLVTLAVTYVLQVLVAVAGSRAASSQILRSGLTPQDVVLGYWDGERFASIELALTAWASEFAQLSEQHTAYPILHHYHPATVEHSHTVSAAVLDEALTILAFGVAPEVRPAPGILLGARASLRGFLDSLAAAHIEPSPEPPEAPDRSRLREAGVPLVEQGEFDRALDRERGRRRLLLGMVQDSAWDWPKSG